MARRAHGFVVAVAVARVMSASAKNPCAIAPPGASRA